MTEDKAPYLDPGLPVQDRVKDLLERMTLEEKVGQMCQYLLPDLPLIPQAGPTPEPASGEDTAATMVGGDTDDSTMHYTEASQQTVPSLIAQGLIGSILSETDPERLNEAQALAEQSRLGIPLLLGIDAIHGNAMHRGATVFPAPIGLAATWDTDLVTRVAKATAREMHACNLHWTFSPNVDVLRDGRWGRSGETFGEDPYLVGRMGVAMVRGYQDEESPEHYVMACAKHYIAGGEPPNGLNFAAMDLSERGLREVFLPPFADAVAAGVDTVMAAHNEVNGVPCHGNHYLLTEVLRDELGFDGFIVSDWTDVARLFTLHHVATSIQDADRMAVEAGIDMHMHGPGFLEPIVELVEAGELGEERIDAAVARILEAKFRLGLFENRYVDPDATLDILGAAAHRELALESARESVVLLTNVDGVLPLNKELTRIFVTGPNADNQTILGDWSVAQPDEEVVTILQGIRNLVRDGTVVDYLDCGTILEIDDDAIESSGDRARVAEIAIVVAGENPLRYTPDKTEGENVARTDLGLAGRQRELIETVVASGTPTIVVLVNGRPLSVTWVAEHAAALVEAFHPGTLGGQAVAEVLFGETNPSGRLPYTVPRSVGQLRAVYNHRPGDYFRQYQLTPNAPLFPFGHGLSYTTFDYETITVPKTVKAGEDVTIEVTVSNTGKRAGDDVVIGYLHDDFAGVTRPVKEVVAFKRIHLEAGESRTVTLTIKADQLALYDVEMSRVVEPGDFTLYIGSETAHFTVVA
jgi:beta-glucosidase